MIIKRIIVILLESKLLDHREHAQLEMHYDFNQEGIMKEIESSLNQQHRVKNY